MVGNVPASASVETPKLQSTTGTSCSSEDTVRRSGTVPASERIKCENDYQPIDLDIDFLAGFTSWRFLLVVCAVFIISGAYAFSTVSVRRGKMQPHKIASMLDREAVLHVRPVCSDVGRCVDFFTKVMGGFESKSPGGERLIIFAQVSLAPVLGDPSTAVPLDFRLGEIDVPSFVGAIQDVAKEHNFNITCTEHVCIGDIIPPLHFHRVPLTFEKQWEELRVQFVARASDARGLDLDFSPLAAVFEKLPSEDL